MPDMTSFYRWHLADPVVFRESLRVTIQQIGAVFVLPRRDGEARRDRRAAPRRGRGLAALAGRVRRGMGDRRALGRLLRRGIRVLPGAPGRAALSGRRGGGRSIGRLPYEQPSPAEGALDFVGAAIEG